MQNRIYLSPPQMSGNEQKYIQQAFDTNWIAPLGPNVDQFEEKLCAYTGMKHALALQSGTAAIHLALKYLGVKQGDLVLCSSLTFAGSVNAVLYEKAIPVFIDADEDTWNISPRVLEIALKDLQSKGTLPKALITVNLLGQSADYDAILPIAKAYQIPIIEDAAESLGATYKGVQTGNFGEMSIFSFNGNKIITTSGGGALLSNDLDALNKCRFWSTQSREKALHYEHKEVGYNYRLSNVLAGIGLGQMEVLNQRIARKKEIFTLYQSVFAVEDNITMMPIATYGEPNYWLTAIRIHPDLGVTPTDVVKYFNTLNIEARHLWKPMHQQPVFKDCLYYANTFDVADRLFQEAVCLPSGGAMDDDTVRTIGELLLKFCHSKK